MHIARASPRHGKGRRAGAALLASAILVVLQLSPLDRSSAHAAPGLPPQDVGADGYSPYESESSCSATVKPGARALRDFVLRAYPGTRDFGILRSCSVGGPSGHWQGRAWDWGVDYYDPEERALADDFIFNFLLVTDEYGEPHSKARRLGIRYLIWNAKIAKSYSSPRFAWSSSSGHRDHVHFSLSWAGAWSDTDAYKNMHMAPDQVSWSPFDQALFSRTAGNTLRQRSWVSGAWQDVNDFGGPITSGPGATSWDVNRVDVFVRGQDFALYQKSWDPAGWIPVGHYNWLGTPPNGLQSGPDAASWTSRTGNRHLNVFARGPNRELWTRTYNSSSCPCGWSGWHPVDDPGVLTSDPGAVSWAPGRVDVVVRSSSNGIFHKWCCPWSGWADLGGILEGGPDITSRGVNDLWVFARNPGRDLFFRRWNGHIWEPWVSLGAPSGGLTSDPTAVHRSGEVHVAARGADGAIWGRVWTPVAGWSGWVHMGGTSL